MATVNLDHVQFWQPPSKPLFHKQRTASQDHNKSTSSATSSQNQLASLHNKADPTFECTNQPRCAVAATRYPGGDLEA